MKPKSKHPKRPKPSPAHKSQQRALQQTYVYVLNNFPYFWKFKFGISDKPKYRARGVSDTTPGEVGTLIAMRIPFGYQFEQFVHFVYAPLRRPFEQGSGRSEWFLGLSPITFLIMLTLELTGVNADVLNWFQSVTQYDIDTSGLGLYLALFFFCPMVWFDGVLLILIARVFWYFVAVVIFFAFIYFLQMK